MVDLVYLHSMARTETSLVGLLATIIYIAKKNKIN